ncbi:pyridoxal 5'-phosphate synthase glutaminase subunit PdxT [Lachnospira multipara]|uniref:Pyridoxal 5'-phosphate synthase subunit PdxT n=1 Tax=Lachnospira multipara TaxID=28051 RepID=A0A1H5WHD5_9FIRM|nr:pyridoxal 5'-phosphate synthase glutaminase subunit PdxT [Lachnospira multipara]SEF98641.1 5'-phosphate synthase pdxT subunit [Lachnospira multipara]
MIIGVLALQGAFIEHINSLRESYKALSFEFNGHKETTNLDSKLETNNLTKLQIVEIRQLKDLEKIDALVLPGGESTVQGKLLKELGLLKPIKERIESGMPVLATCAGLILLAKEIENEKDCHLGTFPIKVVRNAYGRQLGSFVTTANVGAIKDFPLCFIRAPYVKECLSKDVEVLSVVDDKIVGVKYKNQIGLAFHPEMTTDKRIHEEFLKLVLENCKNRTSNKLAS